MSTEFLNRRSEFLNMNSKGAQILCSACGKVCVDNVPADYRTSAECICEALRLAVELADELSFSSIDSQCRTEFVDGAQWADLDTQSSFDPRYTVEEAFPDEIRYCELRGLLRRHPERPNLVQEIEP